MKGTNDYIEVLFCDFAEGNTGKNECAEGMINAARELQAAIMRGNGNCWEEVDALEYASMRYGFYAGFMAARGIFMG